MSPPHRSSVDHYNWADPGLYMATVTLQPSAEVPNIFQPLPGLSELGSSADFTPRMFFERPVASIPTLSNQKVPTVLGSRRHIFVFFRAQSRSFEPSWQFHRVKPWFSQDRGGCPAETD